MQAWYLASLAVSCCIIMYHTSIRNLDVHINHNHWRLSLSYPSWLRFSTWHWQKNKTHWNFFVITSWSYHSLFPAHMKANHKKILDRLSPNLSLQPKDALCHDGQRTNGLVILWCFLFNPNHLEYSVLVQIVYKLQFQVVESCWYIENTTLRMPDGQEPQAV